MPLYENWTNVVNALPVSADCAATAAFGTDNVLSAIAEAILRTNARAVALDGWYGVDYALVAKRLTRALEDAGKTVVAIDFADCFKGEEAVRAYKQTYITDDPGFGWVNDEGTLSDLVDADKADDLVFREGVVTLVCGPGSYAEGIRGKIDLLYYFDKTMQPMLWQMWGGELIPFGAKAPAKGYGWKEYYYCDYYLLARQKRACLSRMDGYVEAIHMDDLKLITGRAYAEIMDAAAKCPVKQVPILQPGPWGAYRFKDRGWDLKGLTINAWNLNVGPELSMVLDFGGEKPINVPFLSLMDAHASEVVGPKLSAQYKDLFPFHVWLDDGYFPDKQPAERTSMPIHNHPDTAYVKRHFNEPLGRYETYYIAEAFEGANTWMGFKEDCDMEEFEKKCRESNNLTVIENWRDYIANWKSNVGDLFLIPPGTVHCHGGNQTVLEMDTCPSVCGTEYSFFQYDFARNTWDDEKKTMTGKPMKMHLEHAFDNERWRRENFVREKHLAKPEIVKWTKDYWRDRYASQPEMPYDVERVHYYERAEGDTEGEYTHVGTLSVGTRTTVRSLTHPEMSCTINAFQSVVIPACFGRYELVNEGRNFSTFTMMKWKRL